MEGTTKKKRTRKKVDIGTVTIDSTNTTFSLTRSTIELICTKTGKIKDVSKDHAERILNTQTITRQGTYKLYNEQLYTYDEGSRTIEQRQSEPSEGDSFVTAD